MIIAGFGFTTRATLESLQQALEATGYADQVTMLATPSDKAAQSVMLDLARARKLPINAVSASNIAAAKAHTQSLISRVMRNTGSVAEAAALAAADPGATLLVTRQISADRMATCAIAKGADT